MSTQHTQDDAGRLHSINLIVHGATGRMGRRIVELARSSDTWNIVATASRSGLQPAPGERSRPSARAAASPQNPRNHANLAGAIPRADLVIDFSSDQGARAAIDLARSAGAALLTGSTGLSQPTVDALRHFAIQRPTLAAPNTSRGVAVVARLAAQAAALGREYDAAIIETHHKAKQDAPSGTALRLAEALGAAGVALGRDRIASVRVGGVIGEHIIRFEGPHDSVEIIHRAHSRDLFAAGALSAGAWLVQQPPGWYTMEDVLGFASEAG